MRTINCPNCFTNVTEGTKCVVCDATMHDECINQCQQCKQPMCDDCVITYKKCKSCRDLKQATISMDFISSTMFESYEKCPFLFYNEHILKKFNDEEKDNKYNLLGTLVHDLCCDYSTTKRKLSFADLHANYCVNFLDIKQKYFDDKADRERFFHIGLDCLNNFYKQEQSLPEPSVTEEQWFITLNKDLPTIRVTIDRINGDLDNPSELCVDDYKTGKVYTSDMLRKNMQLPIYAMAVKHKYGDYPKQLRLRFLQHDKERIFEHTKDGVYVCNVKGGGIYKLDVDKTLDKMKEIWYNISHNVFPRNTKNEYFCRDFCPLGKTKQCDGISTKWASTKYDKRR